jgi:hypothetical protein
VTVPTPALRGLWRAYSHSPVETVNFVFTLGVPVITGIIIFTGLVDVFSSELSLAISAFTLATSASSCVIALGISALLIAPV